MKHTLLKLLMLALALTIILLCNFCKDSLEGQLFRISDELMVDDYITEKDQSMTLFLDIVDRAKMRGTIHAYGVYTCFIPTNEAVQSYLQAEGKASVADLTQEECMRIVKYHMVRHEGADAKPLLSSDFIDGRLPSATMLAKYLTTRAVDAGAEGVKIKVNRQGDILKNDNPLDRDGILVANGCIHKLSTLLTPPSATCGEMIRDSLGDEYSIFREVLNMTGWTQHLIDDKADLTWYTVFLQHNDAFTLEGKTKDGLSDSLLQITTPEELADYLYSEEDAGNGVMKDGGKLQDLVRDPSILNAITEMNPGYDVDDKKKVALWLYAAYHCVKSLYYAADLVNTSAVLTCAPNQAITVLVRKDSLLLNEYINKNTDSFEPGIPVNKQSDYTDMSCYNGVLVNMAGYIGPQKRGAQAIYWEVTEQPEFKRHPDYRERTFNCTQSEVLSLSEIKVTYQSGAVHTDNEPPVGGSNAGTFYYNHMPYDSKVQYTFKDALGIKMADIAQLEFTLPLLTPGDYNVWIAWRRADVNACRAKATYIEGADVQELGSVGFHENFATGKDPLVLLAQGMKRYTAKRALNTMNCRRFGTIRVNSTGRHKLRLDVIERGRATTMWIDQIQFIPIDADQLWPRFDVDGNRIELGTPCEEIAPTNNTSCN